MNYNGTFKYQLRTKIIYESSLVLYYKPYNQICQLDMKVYGTFWGVPKRLEGPEIMALFPVKFATESLWNLLLVTENSLIILYNM
jgi:hypothetical protein